MGRRRWMVFTACALAIAASTIFYLRRSPATRAQAPAAALELPPEINLPGKIRAVHVVDVAPPQEGMISVFHVNVGDEVSPGQLLARITNDNLENERAQMARVVENAQARVNDIESAVISARLEASRARAEASRARSENDRLERAYQRQQMLYREGATPRVAFEKITRDYEMAQSEHSTLNDVATRSEERASRLLKDLDAAKRVLEEKNAALEEVKGQLGNEELHAPVDGVVLSRNGAVGEQVSLENKDFIQIATQLSQLEVVIDPEPPVLKVLRPGQPALVIAADQAGDGLMGEVKEVNNHQAVIAFNNPNPSLKPGMTAQVRIKTK